MKKLQDLYGLPICVYDTEIENCIGENGITWESHDRMGISVAAVFDYRTGDTTVYLKDNMAKLAEHLNSARILVGYNIVNFDNRLCRASGVELKYEEELRCYDMLVEVRKGMGWTEGGRFPGGCKLDDVLVGTFGEKFRKTADGAEAPRMFQRGAMGELISYNIGDVRRERMVFEEAYLRGEVRTPTHGVHRMANPLDLLV